MPPSQFDIRFYYGGSENINLPPISTCVLKSIDVNYAPNGWSAYEVPGEPASLGRTGMPVATQLTLQFQETSYLTKNTPGDPSPTNAKAPIEPGPNDSTITGKEAAFGGQRQ